MKNAVLWILAFLITASTAMYQRRTGPTYPFRGKTIVKNSEISYRLPRTHETGKDCLVQIETKIPDVEGTLLYKRLKTADSWSEVAMERQGDLLLGALPYQPPAGKLEYKVFLSYEGQQTSLSGENPLIIRFKGRVPIWILIPHVAVMFLAMLFSARAGLEALKPHSNPRKLALWTTGLLFVGGFILGPAVQKMAFGSLWTGFPFGHDLTDNKTLIAFIGWIIAVIAGRKGKPARGWVLAAAILLFVVFMIPHSLLGSELDYSNVSASQSSIHFKVNPTLLLLT